MGGAPGQRHGRVDDVAVHHDFSPGAEYAYHAADRGTDLAGCVVVDDVVVLMGAQVGGQGADAVLLLSGTARISTPCASSAGAVLAWSGGH